MAQVTLWDALHKLIDAVAYGVTTKYLIERWWRWYQARAERKWLESDAERRLLGPQREGGHPGLAEASEKQRMGRLTGRPSKDGSRYHRWPVQFGWARNSAVHFFDWHGWQTHAEQGGKIRWFGQTLHVGALKIYLGPKNAG